MSQALCTRRKKKIGNLFNFIKFTIMPTIKNAFKMKYLSLREVYLPSLKDIPLDILF